MHHAHISRSPRLRRALKALQDAGGEISTYDLARKADVCAVNSVIAELRENGAVITCRQDFSTDQRRFFYTLISSLKVSS